MLCILFFTIQWATILIIDGRGSLNETQSLFYAKDNKIKLLYKSDKIGIGLLYATITEEIGFKILEEGKTMGLAPHGANFKKFMIFLGKYKGIETSYENFCIKNEYKIKKHLQKKIVSFQDKAKAAFEVQKETEKAMLHLVKFAKSKINVDNLCISGGVALNCVANNVIKKAKYLITFT